MPSNLELLSCILIDEGRSVHSDLLNLGRERDRSDDNRSRILSGQYNLLHCLVDELVFESLHDDSDISGFLGRHGLGKFMEVFLRINVIIPLFLDPRERGRAYKPIII